MKIKFSKNGPLLISSQNPILKRGDDEEKIDSKMIALCRCGHSANKPFCDGSHSGVNFKADELEIDLS